MTDVRPTGVAASELLEREAELGVLREELAAPTGRLVLIAGEAGAGKSSLVRAFCADLRRERVLWGSCDSLLTPRPLGPLLDVAAETGGALAEATRPGDGASEVLSALLDELRARPTVLVLEDFHWADGATLDILRLLGRRLPATGALALVTYRDDELEPSHPLRVALGGLEAARLRVPSFSPAAVHALAEPAGFDGDELYRRTGGNPFFVTEVLAAGDDELPETVRDAVLARVAHLEPAARRLLEAVALVPARAELSLLESLVGVELGRLDECLASGMLREDGDGVAFRHELARLAVEEAVTPDRRRRLHGEILRALAAAAPDPARLAHHAEGAGDAEAVRLHAPAAGARAAALGAHREAAAHYERALRFSDEDELLEPLAHEQYLSGQNEAALATRQKALARKRATGDRLGEGVQLCWLARLWWHTGHHDEAEEAAHAAVELLEPLPPGPELALAYATMTERRSISLDPDGAAHWGARAIALAEELGATEIVVRTLLKVGIAESLAGRGTEQLQRGFELAREHGFDELVARAYGDLAVIHCRHREWADADRTFADGLRFTTERNLETDRAYLLVWRATAALSRSRWQDAAADLADVLRDPGVARVVRATGLLALGQLRARLGDPGVREPLDEALEIALRAAEPPKIAPLAIVRAEAAMLAGDPERALAELEPYLPAELADRWIAGELAVWARRAGGPDRASGPVPPPFALELAGRHTDAAAAWSELGCAFEAALSLAWSSDVDELRRAHEAFQDLGARPAAALVARRLRSQGARGIGRGPRPSTRENPVGLTARELEVLGLVAEGLRNAEIADRLFLSPKTVDHHVSAILRKLPARTRAEAGAQAVRLGLAKMGSPPDEGRVPAP